MKTLYVHIGMPKTATTSLQAMLDGNSERLHSLGFSFPIPPFSYVGVGRRRTAHFLVGGSLETKSDSKKSKAPYEKRLAQGLEMIHENFAEYDNVLISDENLWSAIHYSKHNILDILAGDAREHGYLIKVIAYLRRQDSYILSVWNQQVKKAGRTQTAQEYVDFTVSEHPLILDYAGALDSIAAAVGKDNLIVRRFDPSSWVGGDIYTDFLTALGLPSDGFAFPEQEKNPRLDGNYPEIMRLINQIPELTYAERTAFSSCAREASDAFGSAYSYSMLSTSETAELLGRYREGNERVAREYIGDGRPLFSDEIKDLPKYDIHNDYWREDLIHFFASVALRERRERKSLGDELKAQSKDVQELREKLKSQSQDIADMKKRLDSQQNAIEANKKETEKLRGMIRHPFRTVWRFIKGKFKKKK